MSKWTPLYSSCLKNEAAVSSLGRGRQGVVLVFVWLLSTVLVRSGPRPRSWIWEPSPDSRLVWLRPTPGCTLRSPGCTCSRVRCWASLHTRCCGISQGRAQPKVVVNMSWMILILGSCWGALVPGKMLYVWVDTRFSLPFSMCLPYSLWASISLTVKWGCNDIKVPKYCKPRV